MGPVKTIIRIKPLSGFNCIRFQASELFSSILDHVPYRTDHDHDGSWNMKCTDWVRTLRTSGGKDTRGSSRVEPTLFGDAAIVSAAAFSRLYRFPSAVTPFRRIIHTWERGKSVQNLSG